MPGSRQPGPLDGHRDHVNIKDGTLNRQASPGRTGVGRASVPQLSGYPDARTIERRAAERGIALNAISSVLLPSAFDRPLRVSPSAFKATLVSDVIPKLTSRWLDHYLSRTDSSDIVKVSLNGFSYLFDFANQRLVAAWVISGGRNAEARDKNRMKGHPLGEEAGAGYHRGHAIPHSLGGGTDVNLVTQLGSVNLGRFRKLEREAVKTPSALYFTYWLYNSLDSQKPCGVEQGFLCNGRPLQITKFVN